MTPVALLILAVWLTGVAAAADALVRRRRARALRQLAVEWGMNYSPIDPFRIARKIAAAFPVPGAADLHVADLIYGSDRGRYRYVFTIQFTVGTTGTKRRLIRVASFSEPRGRDATEPAGPVTLAPGEGTWLDQYRSLAPDGKREEGSGFGVQGSEEKAHGPVPPNPEL